MKRQKDIAKEIGLSNSQVSAWLKGKTGISREKAIKLADVYGRDPGFWMFGDLEEIKSVLFFTCAITGPASDKQRCACNG